MRDNSNILDVQFSQPRTLDKFITETQLAQRWQVSKKLVQKQRHEGTGAPYVKIGRIVRYRVEEVLGFEDACRRINTCEGEKS